jgi:NitT/TauT family transport system substrate-binding protein
MKSIMTTRRALGSLAAGLALGRSAAAQAAPLRFTTDWAWQGSQAIWPMAERIGAFAKEGLNVTMERGFGAADAIGKVATGVYDMGFADFNTLVQFNARNPDKAVTGVFMVYDGTPSSIVSLKSGGVAAPRDLAGKRIASPVFDASRQMFPLFAQANGLDPASVEWVGASPELREPMLARKQVDAIAGHMWTGLIGLEALGVKPEEVNVMLYSSLGLDLFGSVLITRPEWAAANAAKVTGFIRAVAQGINACIADPGAAIAALRGKEGLVDVAVEQRRLQLSLDVAVLTPNVRQNGLNAVDPARMRRSVDRVAEIFGVSAPETSVVWTDAYLPARDQLRARAA